MARGALGIWNDGSCKQTCGLNTELPESTIYNAMFNTKTTHMWCLYSDHNKIIIYTADHAWRNGTGDQAMEWYTYIKC